MLSNLYLKLNYKSNRFIYTVYGVAISLGSKNYVLLSFILETKNSELIEILKVSYIKFFPSFKV
jgi:hypothetical protein